MNSQSENVNFSISPVSIPVIWKKNWTNHIFSSFKNRRFMTNYGLREINRIIIVIDNGTNILPFKIIPNIFLIQNVFLFLFLVSCFIQLQKWFLKNLVIIKMVKLKVTRHALRRWNLKIKRWIYFKIMGIISISQFLAHNSYKST